MKTVSTIVKTLDDLRDLPACRERVTSYMAQMAISFYINSLSQEATQSWVNSEKEEQKRRWLTAILAIALDNGMSQESMQKMLEEEMEKHGKKEFVFRGHVDEEKRALLLACGETEESIDALLTETSKKQKLSFEEKEAYINDMRSLVQSEVNREILGLANVGHTALYNADDWMKELLLDKVLRAINTHRKYLVNGIARGYIGSAGQLSILNSIKEPLEKDIAQILKDIEYAKQSNYADGKDVERGKVGDDERPDITY